MVLNLAWSNEVKYQRDIEATHQGNHFSMSVKLFFWYGRSLLVGTFKSSLYTWTVQNCAAFVRRRINHFVAPDLFISNICNLVHYSVVYNPFSVLAEITKKLRKDNN